MRLIYQLRTKKPWKSKSRARLESRLRICRTYVHVSHSSLNHLLGEFTSSTLPLKPLQLFCSFASRRTASSLPCRHESASFLTRCFVETFLQEILFSCSKKDSPGLTSQRNVVDLCFFFGGGQVSSLKEDLKKWRRQKKTYSFQKNHPVNRKHSEGLSRFTIQGQVHCFSLP